jgi:hypothetical protein
MPPKERRPLGVCRRYQSPHLLILSRAAKPPVPQLREDDEEEKARDLVGSAGGGLKSEIRGMSKQSSKNLSRMLSILDWSKHGECLHVTLTYWRSYPKNKHDVGKEKQAIGMWFSRNAECGVWRLEFQERGAPHWHVLVWIGKRDAEKFEKECERWWSCREWGTHPEFGCKITSGSVARGRWYLAMHAAKQAQALKPPFLVGRWWGYIERDKVLSASDIDSPQEIAERELVWWKRLYRRQTGCTTRQDAGFTWFLPRLWQCTAHAWIADHVDYERAMRSVGKNPF